MKKFGILALGALISVSALADKIGTVDVAKIYSSFSGLKAIEQSLMASAKKVEKEVEEKSIALQKEQQALAAKGNKLTEEEQKAFQKKVEDLNKFVSEAEMRINKERNTKISAIEQKLLNAAKAVGTEGKYDAIVTKQAVLFGGEDVTAQVLSKMEAMK